MLTLQLDMFSKYELQIFGVLVSLLTDFSPSLAVIGTESSNRSSFPLPRFLLN